MSVIDDGWNFGVNFQDIEVNCFQEFRQKNHSVQEKIMLLLGDGFKIHRIVFNGSMDPNNDEDLRLLIDRNKQLRQDIDKKLEDLGRQQNKYESFKKDQKLLSQEITETHEAFLMAKKYYKKFLKLYYSIENRNKEKQTVFIQFFTEAKKESENYSVRLLRDTKSGHYELLSTSPKLSIHKELEKKIKETNDVPGILCCIRNAFLKIKGNKNMS